MNKFSLKMYYASMITYMIGGIPLVLYSLIIRPIALLYHEPISSMVSPVFGNYGLYLRDLFIISLAFVTTSLILYLISVYTTRRSSGRISTVTIVLPIALYVFGYVLLGVSAA